MLEYFLTVSQQIFTMFLMVVVGYVMYKAKLVSENGAKEMSVLLLKIVTPMILISAFQREFDTGLFKDWIIMFFASALTYLIHIILAEIFYRRRTDTTAEDKMSLVLPNNGFLAFPLLQALAGEFGIFLGSTSVIILNILMWTYAVKLMRPHERMSIKNIVTNPGVIGVFFGLILFLSPWKLPAGIFNAIDAIGSLNTPLAMIVLGILLAQTDLKQSLSKLCYYKLSFLKLILAPAIMMLIFTLIPMPQNVRLVAFVCSATPTATAVSMLSQLFDSNYKYATNAVVITTVLSALTMPIILAIGKVVIGY